MTLINTAYINKSIENLAIQIVIWQKMHFLMLAYSIFVRWTTIHSMWNTIWHPLRDLDWIRRDTKSVQIRSFFLVGLLAPLDWIWTNTKSIQMRENTDQNKLRIWTLAYLDTWYLDTFHTVIKSQNLNDMPMPGRLIILWAFSGITEVFYIGEFIRDDIDPIGPRFINIHNVQLHTNT